MIGYRSERSVFYDEGQLAAYLVKDQSQFRIYSPSFELLQHVAYYYDLEVAEGVDPLQLRSYVNYINNASGFVSEGYSVTVPELLPDEELRSIFSPDPAVLGLLNIKYILVDFDMKPHNGLVLIEQIGGTRIYENLMVKPRAWVYTPGRVDDGSIRPVVDYNWSPNHIKLNAEGPGRLVISEVNYPGWLARVDGDAVDIQTEADILRSIDLPPGEHQVEFVFRPMSLYIGVLISSIAWILVLIFVIKSRGNISRK
jgi:hypothetical protein